MDARIAQLMRSIAFAAAAVLPIAPAAGQAGSSKDHDALTAARFELTIDGHALATFFELTSLSVSAAPGDPPPAQQAPGVVQLRRGFTRNVDLWNWFQNANGGAVRNAAVLVLYDRRHKPVATYHLVNAWPAKVEIGALKAGASEVLMETVTIVCERIERVSP
ncbi:MAG: phage tail protein [Burkholderiales bacterium]